MLSAVLTDLARRAAIVLGLVVAIIVITSPARAHDPVFLTGDQATPETGPYLPDGTISFAVYGRLDEAGDTRGFQVELAAGDRLVVEVLVPDLAPENALATGDLPVATVTAPDGTSFDLAPERREPFFEPFTQTSYLRLGGESATAQAGVYDVVVTGSSPARFTVAIGTIERFGTPVERVTDRSGSVAEWYAAPPAARSGDGSWGGSRVLLATAAVLALGGPLALGAVRRRRRIEEIAE